MAEHPSSDISLQEDPLRERLLRETRFRPDDPPEVREAILQAAMGRECAFHREALERYPSS